MLDTQQTIIRLVQITFSRLSREAVAQIAAELNGPPFGVGVEHD